MFWDNRLADTDGPTRANETRIPELPDQTEFLQRWFEFYQGYKTVRLEDGSETRVAVLGEAFREVSPGTLPRTLDELRSAGTTFSSVTDRSSRRQPETQRTAQSTDEPSVSLDDALDELLQEAENEGVSRSAQQAPQQAPQLMTELSADVKRQLVYMLNAANSLQSRVRRLASNMQAPSRNTSFSASWLRSSSDAAAPIAQDVSKHHWK